MTATAGTSPAGPGPRPGTGAPRLQVAQPVLAEIDELDPLAHVLADDAVHRIWPPCATAITRAARFTSEPNQSPSRSVASPACTPMRTRSSSPSGHCSAHERALRRHRRADAVVGRRERRRRRRRCSSRPGRHAPRPRPEKPSWRASAARIASGCSSHRRVDPSRSVNRNVTVPDGNSLTPTPLTVRSRHASKPGKPDERRLISEPHKTPASEAAWTDA